MIIIKGGHRRGGAGGYIHVRSLRRREARSSGRADQDGGDPRRRSPRRASSRAPQTPGLIQSLLRYRSTWLAPSFVRLVLRKRSPARWPTHSPFRHFRASISSFATPTVPRAGAGTTRCWPAVGLIRFRGLQVFGPLHGLPAPTRALRRPPRAAPLCVLRPQASPFTHPSKPPAIRLSDEPANRQNTI